MKEDFVVQFPRLVKSLRALTKVILVYTPTAYDIPLRGIEVDFRKRKSFIIIFVKTKYIESRQKSALFLLTSYFMFRCNYGRVVDMNLNLLHPRGMKFRI